MGWKMRKAPYPWQTSLNCKPSHVMWKTLNFQFHGQPWNYHYNDTFARLVLWPWSKCVAAIWCSIHSPCVMSLRASQRDDCVRHPLVNAVLDIYDVWNRQCFIGAPIGPKKLWRTAFFSHWLWSRITCSMLMATNQSCTQFELFHQLNVFGQ